MTMTMPDSRISRKKRNFSSGVEYISTRSV